MFRRYLNRVIDGGGDSVGFEVSEERYVFGVHVLFSVGLRKYSRCYYFRDVSGAMSCRDGLEARYWGEGVRVELCEVESVLLEEVGEEYVKVLGVAV